MVNDTHIYIVERDLFVSQDMAHSIRLVLPSAICSVFATVAEARSSVTVSNAPQLVIVSADVDGMFTETAVDAKWLVQNKAIVFDARNRVSHPDWIYLDKPFSEGELMKAVQTLLSHDPKGNGTMQMTPV